MLSTEALNSALPLAQMVDAANLKLSPIPGTALEKLVQATRADNNFSLAEATGGFQPSIPDIVYIANAKDEMMGGSPHDFAMDNIVEVATKAVQEHIAFARTVVAPAVAHLVESTTQTLNQITPSSLLGMEVVVCEPAAPLQNPGMENMVRRFESTPFLTPALAMRLPNMAASDIMALMSTGSSVFDGDVQTWLAAKGESFVLKVWENIFQIKQAELNETRPVTFRTFIDDKEEGADWALAIFLLARKLLDTPPEGTEMNLQAYSNLMADFRDQAAARVCRELDQLAKVSKVGVLVKSVSGNKTMVHSFVYRNWIEQGGSNEVLFGNCLMSPPMVTVDNLNAKAEELKAKWARHSTLTATVEANKKFLRTKDALLRHFVTSMREIGEDGLEAATVANREAVIVRFRELLDEVRDDELKDLWSVSLKLVCRSRFARTEAERILADIERVKRENPSIDVREAAAISVINYIAYWLSSQFQVVSVK